MAFGTTLLLVMASAAFFQSAVGVLGPVLIAEFSIRTGQVGWLAAVMSLVAAGLAPVAGRIVDRQGHRRVIIAMFLLSGIALWTAALAPSFPLLLLASSLSGIAMAAANPATNAAIRRELPVGERGSVAGLKQSGVKFGQFVTGFALPPLIPIVGWRPAVAVVGAAAACCILLAVPSLRSVPVEQPRASVHGPAAVRSPLVTALLTYVLVMAAAQSAILTYLPLFAFEVVGFGVRDAGFTIGVLTGVAVIARIIWARLTERSEAIATSLVALALQGLFGSALLFFGHHLHIAWFWLGIVLVGASVATWNAVVQMAIIDRVPSREQGRAAGVVQVAFLLGLATGPIVYGQLYDLTGAHGFGASVVAMGLVGAALWARWGISGRGS